MYKINDFDVFNLVLKDGRIHSYADNATGAKLLRFHSRVNQNTPKLYILKEGKTYLYVGTTTQPLSTRIRYGLTVDGRSGYHGYKWKTKEKVQLLVWCFPDLGKIEIESIESELVFLIRQKTGRWPLTQNEIHFNNEFPGGKIFARKLFIWTEKTIANSSGPCTTPSKKRY